MRHLLGNIITYSVACLLFLGAVLFARMRSSQYTLTRQPAVLTAYEPSPAYEFRWQELGRETYRSNCRSCHAEDGRGWDQYPPVTGAAGSMLTPGGRERLIDVQLYGLSNEGSRVPMPPMGHLHDVEVAAVLNHIVTGFGGISTAARSAAETDTSTVAEGRAGAQTPQLFTPAEIRARRH